MPTTKQKGNQRENEAKKILEGLGYTCHKVTQKSLFLGKGKHISWPQDIHGADIIALKSDDKVRFVQVTDLKNAAAHRDKFPVDHFNPEHMSFEIWARLDGKKAFRVWELMEQEYDLAWEETTRRHTYPGKLLHLSTD